MPEDREPQGHLDLQDLHRRWSQCDQLRQSAQQAAARWDRRTLCPRTVDERLVGGHRGYAAAERYLTTSDENHDALISLLEHHGATPTAPWNLLRPSFESAFYALWLLTPEDSVERRRRGIRLEWLDDIAATKFHEVALGNRDVLRQIGIPSETVPLPRVNANHQTYVAEADATRLPYRTTKHRKQVNHRPARVNVEQALSDLFPGDELMTLAHTITWKTLSGLQHSEASALLRVTDRSPVGSYPGGRRFLLTINDGAFYLACLATTTLRALAWARYGECHRPARSNDPIDLAALRDIVARYRTASSGESESTQRSTPDDCLM